MRVVQLSLLLACALAEDRPAPQPPSVGAATSGVYRNMFAEAGYAQSAIDAKLDAAFAQLYFHGDGATQRIYFEVPAENASYVTDAKNHDVRTEGMGYGMMAMLQRGNRTGFDMLWRWVKLHLYHGDKTDPNFGWSAWHADTNGTRLAQGPAPDGETWFITSLFFAAARWGSDDDDAGGGSGGGAFNYAAEAETILAAVNSKPAAAANMFDPVSRIVRFDPGCSFTDPSYLLPAFYSAWATTQSSQSSGGFAPAGWPRGWHDAAAAARDALHASVNGSTGLGPHSCDFGGGAPRGCAVRDANCRDVLSEDDAWRVGRNWALDFAWWAVDERQVALSNAVLAFFSREQPWPVWSIGGAKQCGNAAPLPCRGLSSGRASMNAVAALASNSSLAWAFVDALWQAPIPSGDDRDTDRYLACSGSLP